MERRAARIPKLVLAEGEMAKPIFDTPTWTFVSARIRVIEDL